MKFWQKLQRRSSFMELSLAIYEVPSEHSDGVRGKKDKKGKELLPSCFLWVWMTKLAGCQGRHKRHISNS